MYCICVCFCLQRRKMAFLILEEIMSFFAEDNISVYNSFMEYLLIKMAH